MEDQEVFEELVVETVEVKEEKVKKPVKPSHPLSGVALALSILSCWFAPQMGLIAFSSLIMSIMSMVDSKKKDYGAKGMNVMALIFSILAVAMHVVLWALVALFLIAYFVLYAFIIIMIIETNGAYYGPEYYGY